MIGHMTAPDTSKPDNTFYTTFGDRRILVYEATSGQTMIVAKTLAKFKRKQIDSIATYALLGDVWDALIVEDDDREYVERLIITGKIDLTEFGPLLRGESTEDDQEPEPVTVKPQRSRAKPKANGS